MLRTQIKRKTEFKGTNPLELVIEFDEILGKLKRNELYHLRLENFRRLQSAFYAISRVILAGGRCVSMEDIPHVSTYFNRDEANGAINALTDVLANNTSLQFFDFSKNELSHNDWSYFMSALKQNQTLRVLNLRDNNYLHILTALSNVKRVAIFVMRIRASMSMRTKMTRQLYAQAVLR